MWIKWFIEWNDYICLIQNWWCLIGWRFKRSHSQPIQKCVNLNCPLEWTIIISYWIISWDWNFRLGLTNEDGKKLQLFCGDWSNLLIYKQLLWSQLHYTTFYLRSNMKLKYFTSEHNHTYRTFYCKARLYEWSLV